MERERLPDGSQWDCRRDPPLIASLSEIYSDLEALLPGLQDVDNGLHLTVKTLDEAREPNADDQLCLGPQLFPGCHYQHLGVRPDSGNADSSAADQKSATAVQVGLQRIENSLLP